MMKRLSSCYEQIPYTVLQVSDPDADKMSNANVIVARECFGIANSGPLQSFKHQYPGRGTSCLSYLSHCHAPAAVSSRLDTASVSCLLSRPNFSVLEQASCLVLLKHKCRFRYYGMSKFYCFSFVLIKKS